MMNIRKSSSYPWTRIEGTAHSYSTYFYSGRFGCPAIADCSTKTITVFEPKIIYDCEGKAYKKGGFYEKCASSSRTSVYQMFAPLRSRGWKVCEK